MITTNQEDINAFSRIIDKNEKFFWTGRPNLAAFFVKNYLPTLIFLVIFSGLIMAPVRSFSELLSGGSYPGSSLFSFLFISLFSLGIFILPFAIGLLHALKLRYAFTKSRILICKGVIGTDYKMLEYKQIRNAEVSVGLLDKLMGTGNIHIFTGETTTQYGSSKDVLFAIDNPYEIFKELRSKIDQAKN